MVLVQFFVIKLLGSVFGFFAVFCCSFASCLLARFAFFCDDLIKVCNITFARLMQMP